jgi:hypothetical protein
MMKHLKFIVSLLLVFIWLLTVIGCGGPVAAKKRAANCVREISIARGAPTYAPTEFNKAMTLWDKAEALMKEQKEKEARLVYIEAKDAFENAIWAIEVGKRAAAAKGKTSVSVTK